MDDDIDSMHGADESLPVAHIADEIAQAFVVEPAHLHFMLFQLVAAEDDDLLRLLLLEQNFCKLLAEGPGPAGDEHCLIFPIHEYLFFSRAGL